MPAQNVSQLRDAILAQQPQASFSLPCDCTMDWCTQNINYLKNKLATLGKESELIIPAMEGFKFGCDPEMFVFDPNDQPVPATMFPGTKAEPFKVEGGAWQRDGMAAEFNIDPVSEFKDFNRNIDLVLAEGQKFLPPGYTLRAVSAVRFDEDVFLEAPDDAKDLGCTPDYDAWTGDINPPPLAPDDPYMRCAAGHLHIGWTDDAALDDIQHVTNCRDLVKQLDWYLGYWSTKMDADPTRRKLYGKAGACRYKPYGVEYRVLSNFWVESRDRRLMVWNRMQSAIKDMRRIHYPEYAGDRFSNKIISAINTTSRDLTVERSYRYPLTSINQ